MVYHERMEVMNNLLNNDVWEPIDSLQLSYTSNKKEVGKGKMVSKMTNNSLQQKTLHLYNESLTLNNTPNP